MKTVILPFQYFSFYLHSFIRGNHRGVAVNVLNCDIIVIEFEHQLRYYVPFQTNTLGKGMNFVISQLWDK